MTPRVSVVIPVKDPSHLGAALASVRRQGAGGWLEVVVVNDRGGTDVAKEVGVWAGHARVSARVIACEGRGAAAARNTGVRDARGELIAFLDADDAWTDGSLAPRMDFLNQHPAAGMVFGDMAEFDVSGWVTFSFLRKKGWAADLQGSQVVANAEAVLVRENFVPLPTVLIRRSFFQALGGFDPLLELGEDWDLWLRASRRGAIGLVPIVALHRRLHDRNISRDPVRAALGDIAVLRKFLSEPDGRAPEALRLARRKLAWRYQTCFFGSQRQGDWKTAGLVAARSIAADPSGRVLADCLRLLARGRNGDLKPWATVLEPGWEAIP